MPKDIPMKSLQMIIISILYLSLMLAGTAWAKETAPREKKPAPEQNRQPAPGRDAPIWDKNKNANTMAAPFIQKIEEGVFRVGNITVNKKEESVLIMGQVNMQEGLVEYLACGMAGKLHESVLSLDSEPFHIQIALLLLGLEPGMNPLQRQGDTGTPQGDPIDIIVTWGTEDNKTMTLRAEELLFNQKTGKPMEKTHWIFTGSQIVNGKFMAQMEHSIAASYHDPYAIIDHPLNTGSDDTLYHANKQVLPAKGTPIQFLIHSTNPKNP